MDESTKQINISVVGTEPILVLVDPNNRAYVGDPQDGKSVVSIEDPEAGEWTVNVEDTSNFTILVLVNPNNCTYIGGVQEDKSVLNTEGSVAGDGTLNAEDTSEFLTDVETTEEILMDFGFSVQKPKSLNETSKTPTEGMTLCYSFHNFSLIESIFQNPKIYCRSFC